MEDNDTGILISKRNVDFQRWQFKEFLRLKGINVNYQTLNPNYGKYNEHGEIDEVKYTSPIRISCIYDEHPKQATMKKFGWVSELSDTSIVVQVPYDTPNVQIGSLFFLPSAIDGGQPRKFKVIKMSTLAVYPSYIVCELGPVIEDTDEKSEIKDFTSSNFNLLNTDEDYE